MHKQTIILIVVLALVTGILIFLAVTNQSVLKQTSENPIPTLVKVEKTAKVFFTPATVTATSAGAIADLMVDTGGANIAGVQAELQYDPTAISNVKVIPPAAEENGFFGPQATILFNDVKPETGRISYIVAINPGDTGKTGAGKIGTITFTRAPGATVASSQITFLDKTLVSVLDSNDTALKEATPLTVQFSGAAAPTRAIPLTSPTVAQ